MHTQLPLCERLNFVFFLYHLFLVTCLFKETSGKKDQKMTEVDENLLIIG